LLCSVFVRTGTLLALLITTTLGSACFLSGSPQGQADAGPLPPNVDAGMPFTADPPSVYVAKVKNLMTGLAATEQEINGVANAADDASKRAALITLIDQWMTMPEYTDKMLGFFQQAFQQTQITSSDFMDLIPSSGMLGFNSYANSLLQNVTESFARTVLAEVAADQPLNTAFTTNQIMMTPALMELYAYLDWNQAEDNESVVDSFQTQNPTLTITLEDTTMIPASESVDPKSPEYMQWYFPNLSTLKNSVTVCTNLHTRTFPARAHVLHNMMYGAVDAGDVGTTACNATGGILASAQFTATDFTTWQMVTIRPPKTGEQTTAFWNAAALRTATQLVINTPRVGFFSTPAFQANWPTNTSNMMRVTANQSLIVALGAQVDGTDATNPGTNPPGLDQTHASSGPACLGCHQTLDPTRSILQATYSYGYGQQATTTLSSQKGWFVFQGVINNNVQTLSDFGNQLATHPLFPAAWAQKLCYFANSRACAPGDPEFQNIVNAFTTGGFKWKTLVEQLLSSPITTNALATATTSELGEVVSISRREHLCTLLDGRLGLTDSCGLEAVPGGSLSGIPEIAAGMPSDGYGRGAPIPVLPAQPTLFYRAALENVCEDVANEIVDATSPPQGATTFSSKSSPEAISQFVSNLMDIAPDDPRSSVMIGLLTDHYTAALADKGSSPTYALKSTFITACLSPTVAGIGM
jgi:hypothetical protein